MMQYLTVAQIARKFNLSTQAVYRMVSDGEIPAIRIGHGRGTIRFEEKEIEKWLVSKKEQTTSEQGYCGDTLDKKIRKVCQNLFEG